MHANIKMHIYKLSKNTSDCDHSVFRIRVYSYLFVYFVFVYPSYAYQYRTFIIYLKKIYKEREYSLSGCLPLYRIASVLGY